MSLRNRRLSVFPNQSEIPSFSSSDRGPYPNPIPAVPAIPASFGAATALPSPSTSGSYNASQQPSSSQNFKKAASQPGYVKASSSSRPNDRSGTGPGSGPGARAVTGMSALGVSRLPSAPSNESNANRRKSRVGEKIKNRFSKRYADDLSTVYDAPISQMPISHPMKMAFHVGETLPREMRVAYNIDDSSATLDKSPNMAAGGVTVGSGRGRRQTVSHADERGLPLEPTSKEEEFVKPRGSVAPSKLRIDATGRFDGHRPQDDYGDEDPYEVLDHGISRPRWDFEALGKEKTDVKAYLKRTLAGADPDEVEEFKTALQQQKEENTNELKSKVFQNYGDFVVVSKEIATLENTMMDLKELLNEWKTVPTLLSLRGDSHTGHTGDTVSSGGSSSLKTMDVLERRKTVRNSVLDLQTLYKSQLQDLWSRISGSQKFLHLAPGRHLVCEASNFVELNPATYKVKSSVELFLFTDLLLVASKRRKRADDDLRGGASGNAGHDQSKLVAERCFNLTEVIVVDMKDSGGLTNAFKIKRGKETFIFRTNFADDKKGLLRAFRGVADELSQKKRKESEQEQERRKSVWAGDMMGRRDTLVGSQVALDVSALPNQASGSSAETNAWIDNFEDDLTMAIAVRDWEQSCELVLKGRAYLKTPIAKALPNSQSTTRLSNLSKELIRQLAYDLSDPNIKKHAIVRLVDLLAKLGEAVIARETLLAARQTLLQSRVQMISFQGDIPVYIGELCIVTFTLVKHTSDWYLLAFKDVNMVSGLVNWAKEQLQTFAETFRRQVYGKSVESQVIEDSLRVAAIHNRRLLRDSGLDLTFLLATLLQKDFDSPTVQPNPIIMESAIVRLTSSKSTSSRQTSDAVPHRQGSRTTEVAEQERSQRSDAADQALDLPRPPPRSERRRAAPRPNDI